MFNIGPFELMVLAVIGLIVLGPDRLPGLARDAARMLRNLRDMATGARQQLRDELGPEFADLDLRNLNPRTAVQRAVFGDDAPDLRKFNPRDAVRDTILGGEDILGGTDVTAAEKPVSMTKPTSMTKPSHPNGSRPRPSPRPRVTYDDDAT